MKEKGKLSLVANKTVKVNVFSEPNGGLSFAFCLRSKVLYYLLLVASFSLSLCFSSVSFPLLRDLFVRVHVLLGKLRKSTQR